MNEKAVAVAQDVLKHLNSLKLRQGYYVTGVGDWDPTGDLQGQVDKVQEKCNVCLLGACVLSKARLYDAVAMNQLIELVDPHSLLRDIFTDEAMDVMEAAFELTAGLAEHCDNEHLLHAAVQFGRYYLTLTDRVRAVMENVIANQGVFKPQQIPAPKEESVQA